MEAISFLIFLVVMVGIFHEEVIDTMADVRDYWNKRFGPPPGL